MDETDPRTRILDAAERAFAEHGLAGSRVASIADEAGVNKAMLYYYFDSKERLYRAVLERVFDQVADMAYAVTADPAGDPGEALLGFVQGYRQVIFGHPDFPRLVVRMILDHSTDFVDVVQPRFARMLPLLAGIVMRGQAEGRINPNLDPILTLPALIAPVVFFAVAGPVVSNVFPQLVPGPTGDLQSRWFANLSELSANGLLARGLSREEDR